MNKQIVVHLYNKIMLSNGKKWTIKAHIKFDEYQNNYAEWKETGVHSMMPF